MQEGGTPRERLTAALGPIGVWSFQLDEQPAKREQELVSSVEELGYGAVWIPEGFGSKEAFAHAGILLAGTARIVVATGIASIWARDPMAMSNGSRALAEAYPGRFLLGIGVSHHVRAHGRGHIWDSKPYTKMKRYLEQMDELPAPSVTPPAPRVLAALRPRMLGLARERAWGAHPYFVPVEHTREAREILGPDRFLAPEQLAVLDTNADKARAIGRDFISHYITLPHYRNNIRRLGWTEEDTEAPYSDAFVDAMVAWGDAGAIRTRVHEHYEAGADHVALQVLGEDAAEFPLSQLRELAGVLV
ncbi:MAG: LLM class F420-dependent oxidoreductase [Actinomycetota bacterium]